MTTAKQKKPTAPKKTVVQPAKDTTAAKTRRIKKPVYKSFHLQKRIRRSEYHVPGSWFLLRRSIGTLQRRWKLFLGIGVIYAGLTLFLVHGLSGFENLKDVKDIMQEGLGDEGTPAMVTATTFVYTLLTTNTARSTDATVYQSMLFVIVWLAAVWALRQSYATKLTEKIRIRDSFYRGMGQLIPFVLVVLVIFIELIPAAVGAFLYTTITNGIAVTGIEQALWACLLGCMVLLSLYLVLSTLFALYVSALPDMTPMHALRSARGLVRHRRLIVLARLIMLVLYWFLAVALILIPLIAFVPLMASWAFFVIGIVSFLVAHSYLYALYRELLNE
ncbi:MAG: hypothetical protein WBP26_01175 [Candidatus Saccharimonadales bacterium]